LATNVASESLNVALDEKQDHESFWNQLESEVEEILAEVDNATAVGSQTEQPPIAQHQAGILRQTGISERKETLVMAAAEPSNESQESTVPRRPQNQDEYWSISPSAWLHTSKPRQIILSHVGRINETSEGEQAVDGDCTACARSGAECMVYRDGAGIRGSDKSEQACSRCRFRGSKCSFNTKKKPGRSKRKRTIYDEIGREPTKKMSSRRKLQGSDVAQL
jgi:hypothetical protein